MNPHTVHILETVALVLADCGIAVAALWGGIALAYRSRGERVYLYRLSLSQPAMRQLFLAYVAEANRLQRAPRFHNTLTVNCTTLVYQMLNRISGGGLPLSYRLLFSGYMPEYLYGVGRLDGRYSLQELRDRGFVTERGRQSGRSPTFSADIRKGVPGTDRVALMPSA